MRLGRRACAHFRAVLDDQGSGPWHGLGLALVYAIVTDFGGLIDVKSVPAEGSTFSVYFPSVDEHELPTRRPARRRNS